MKTGEKKCRPDFFKKSRRPKNQLFNLPDGKLVHLRARDVRVCGRGQSEAGGQKRLRVSGPDGREKACKKNRCVDPDLQKPAGKLMPASSAESWCTYTRLRREVGTVGYQIVNEPIEVMRISAAVHLRAFSTVQALRDHQRRKLRFHGANGLLDGFPDCAGFG